MMFTPVRGEALQEFDEETRGLYSIRKNDPRVSYLLASAPRKRNNLPVIVDESNPLMKAAEKEHSGFMFKFLFGFAVWSFACHQYTKAYYPYGIIVRRAVPTSPAKKAMMYGPILGCMGYFWWCHKEKPRAYRADFTCSSEQ